MLNSHKYHCFPKANVVLYLFGTSKLTHVVNFKVLETTQAMLWFSSKSIIQKNGNIGIFQRALKLWEITASFISLHWKRQDSSNSFLIAATTWSYEP